MASSLINDEVDEALEDLVHDLLSSSESEPEKRPHGRSTKGRKSNVDRKREAGHTQLHNDYLSDAPVYHSGHFRRRFRISRTVFRRLCDKLQNKYRYFEKRKDCTGRCGFSVEQKVTAALRVLAYGCAADSVDEYVRMSESTASECVKKFCSCVIDSFRKVYLRCPTESDLAKILERTKHRGFPGIIGSIDCSKWIWKNCPVAWRGQYQGKERKPGVTLEAIADDRLWIWHAFFGTPGSGNDLNVLESSPLLNKICDGSFPPKVSYELNSKQQTIPYFLCDGVYPRYPIFVHTIQEPVTKKEKNHAKRQEGRRKDVERAFGVLQGRWHIIRRPSRFWHVNTMKNVMYCCVIIHNMMVEEGLEAEELAWERSSEWTRQELVHREVPVWEEGENSTVPEGSIAALCRSGEFLQQEARQRELENDVMEHLWVLHGSS